MNVVIREKDIKSLGKKLLKEVYVFLHDDYMLSTFEEIKEEQKKFIKNLTKNNINLDFLKKNDFHINIESIFKVIYELEFDMEIDEDLYFKTNSFLDIFRVFEFGYTYLED